MKFDNSIYYHIYNRGVDKRRLFLDSKDFERFLLALKIYNTTVDIGPLRDWLSHRSDLWNSIGRTYGNPLVEIIAYCLLPNHFHFLLRELEPGGITKFMRRVMTGYVMYFNKKNNRLGTIFQGKLKSKPVTTDEYLIWLSAYINTNSEIHKLAKADKYSWSSWHAYQQGEDDIVQVKTILSHFKNRKDYLDYCHRLIPIWQERREELGRML